MSMAYGRHPDPAHVCSDGDADRAGCMCWALDCPCGHCRPITERVDAQITDLRPKRLIPPPEDRPGCGCRTEAGKTYHSSQTCTDPVVRQLGWYAE